MSDTNGNKNHTLLLDNDENSAFKEGSIDSEHKKNTVNNLLHIEEDDETSLPEVEDESEDSALVETKHSLINSPWSRFGVVGGGAAVIFFMIYLFLGPIMNGNFASKIEVTKNAVTSTATEETKESKKDGDVYAKLALQRQADELAKLNGQKTQSSRERVLSPADFAPLEPPKPITTQTQKDLPEKLPRTTPAQPVQQAATTSEPPIRVAVPQVAPLTRTIIRYLPSRSTPPPIPVTAKPQIALRQVETTKPTDPMAELERLRSLGSAGRIYYTASANTSSTENKGSSNNTDETDYIPRRRLSDAALQGNRQNSKTTGAASRDTEAIELLLPRWTPTVSVTTATKELGTRQGGDYSSEEAGIIEGKQEQYLVVGEHAAATLETPLIWSAGSLKSNSQPQFVTRLTEPLKSNIGLEAIPAGTLLSVEMLLVEQSGRAIAQVTAILKDGTEYPVSTGAISISGTEGKPLIAHQYQKKGGEIFSLDAGLGLVSGLAKVGEVINQPDVQTSISQSGGGFSSSQSSSNGRRSIGAALLY